MTQVRLPASTDSGRAPAATRHPRGARGVGPGVPVAIVAAATTWLTMFAWVGFTQEPGRFLLPTLLVAVVIVALGILSRQWRVSGSMTLLLQSLATLVVVFVSVSGSLLPDRDGVRIAVQRI